MKRYRVRLTQEERASLSEMIQSEKRVSRKKRMHAQVLLKVDEGEHGPGWTDPKAAEAFDVHTHTVCAIRQRLVLEGLEGALQRKKPAEPPRKPIFDEKKEGELLAIAASQPPRGRARWTLRLLAGELVRLEVVDSVSYETVRRRLKKKISSRIVRLHG